MKKLLFFLLALLVAAAALWYCMHSCGWTALVMGVIGLIAIAWAVFSVRTKM